MKFDIVVRFNIEADKMSLANLRRICFQTRAVDFFTDTERAQVETFLGHVAGQTSPMCLLETVVGAAAVCRFALDRMTGFLHEYEAMIERAADHIPVKDGPQVFTAMAAQLLRDCGELKAAYFYLFDIQRAGERARIEAQTHAGASVDSIALDADTPQSAEQVPPQGMQPPGPRYFKNTTHGIFEITIEQLRAALALYFDSEQAAARLEAIRAGSVVEADKGAIKFYAAFK